MKKLKVVIKDLDIDRWYFASSAFFSHAHEYAGYVYDKNHNYWHDGVPEGLAEATFNSPGHTNTQNALRPTRGFYAIGTGGWKEPVVEVDSTWLDYVSDRYRENFNYLVQMIEECQKNNIIFIGLLTPQSPRYKETGAYGRFGIQRSKAPELIQELANLSNKYPNFILMDENKMGDHDYTADMAMDKDHLAETGAVQLTQRIDSLISTLDIDFTH